MTPNHPPPTSSGAWTVGRISCGPTPFLLAARSADLDAMRLLLEHGADPLATTDGDNSALTLAAGVVFLEGGAGQFEGPPKSDVLERFSWRWSSAAT